MVGDILQPTHLLFVLVVALLVLGPKRLPEVGRQLGNGLRDFRAAMNGEHAGHREEIRDPYAEPAGQQPTPAEPSEHEFAHESVETVGEQHQFAHEEAQSTSDAPEFDRSEPVETGGANLVADAGSPKAEHEFAYEPSQPAEKPADPLT